MSRIDLRTSKLLGLALLLGSSSVFAQTVVVTPDDTMGWFETDLAGDATVMISDTGQSTGASGALEFISDTTDDRVSAAKLPLVNLDDITGIGYSYYTDNASHAPTLKLQYWSVTEFGTLNWEVGAGGNLAPTTGSWVSINAMTGVWWNTANSGTDANAQSLAAWQAELGDVLVQFLKVGVGSSWNAAGTMWADLVNLQTADSNTTWDFSTVAPGGLPPVDPADETALVRVIKIFNDGNDELPVTLSLTCTSGTIAPSDVEVTPVGNGSTSVAQHIFVVNLIPDGPPNVCKATESGTDDYDVTALCGGMGEPDEDCGVDQDEDDALGYCQFNNVQADNVAECILVNSPAPVDVDVHKVWEMLGSAQVDVDQDVRITLVCDSEIKGGSNLGNGNWSDYQWLNLDSGDYDDEDDEYVGMGTATFEVIPDFYSTADDPEDQEYTTCTAAESGNDSYVEVDNGCIDDGEGTLMVAAGMGDECTITNTVFFEGIPTLNQYGMAIMALLMLSVGLVGFRRFV